jgi:hypothetical protein
VAVRVQVTIDCGDPALLAEFWNEALGYKLSDPPTGYSTWEEWLTKMGVPEEEWDDGAWIVDPDGDGPRICFSKVPESKVVKNRVHLDLDISSGPTAPLEQRRKEVTEAADRLVHAGGRRLGDYEQETHFHILMQDPEGNEFCLR